MTAPPDTRAAARWARRARENISGLKQTANVAFAVLAGGSSLWDLAGLLSSGTSFVAVLFAVVLLAAKWALVFTLIQAAFTILEGTAVIAAHLGQSASTAPSRAAGVRAMAAPRSETDPAPAPDIEGLAPDEAAVLLLISAGHQRTRDMTRASDLDRPRVETAATALVNAGRLESHGWGWTIS